MFCGGLFGFFVVVFLCFGARERVITCSGREVANLNSKKCGRGEQKLYLYLGLRLRNHAIKSPPPLCQ